MKKSVLIFSITKLEDMKQKGNMTYVKNYEVFFDVVYMVYLLGNSSTVNSGKTKFISLGSNCSFIDLTLAPIRLYRFVKREKIQVFLTADLLFSWWNSLLIKLLCGAKILLIPVAMPHVIYESSGKTITGVLPRFIEKVLIKLSFLSAYKVISAGNIKLYVDWLQNIPSVARKLLVVDVLVDSLPSYDFYQSLNNSSTPLKRKTNTLLYVGRLHKEKLVDDIVESFYMLSSKFKDLELWMIGDGKEKEFLQSKCKKYNIDDRVKFLGNKETKDLVPFYKKATVFVSTLTGTSLREAGLASLPIVCYEMDWVQQNFTHKKELLFAEKQNPNDLAYKIEELLNDEELYSSVATQMDKYAKEHWSLLSIKNALKTLYVGGIN